MTTDTRDDIHGGLEPHQVELVDQGQEIVTVKVWDLPVRVIHWVLFFSVVVLAVTGFYIGAPFITRGGDTGYLMGWMRFIHAVTAWVFMLAVLSRIAWAFLGNRWARWDQFIPVSRGRRRWGRETLKYYVFMKREPPPAVGHNPLAGATYVVVYLMFLFQIVSGLALQSLASPGGWKSWTGGWMLSLMGAQTVRLLHHLVMWTTIAFVIHHIFSAMLIDSEERSGVLSSIVTGYKRVPRERL
jgi:Ni/Fe-hydrogenase 1 B-type cytochrome subunit